MKVLVSISSINITNNKKKHYKQKHILISLDSLSHGKKAL